MLELEKNILQKVKDKLRINYEIDTIKLYDLLNKKRINSHPDKFLDSNLKKKANEDFKEFNSLLSELHTFIQSENSKKTSGELIIFEKEYELINKNQIIIDLEEKIKNLDYSLENKNSEIKALKKALENLKANDLKEKTQELIELYKPTSKNLFSLGISIAIALILGIISKVDKVALIIKKYFPFDPKILNIIIFTVLALIILNYVHKIFEGNLIEKLTQKIKTQAFINKFVIFLNSKDKSDHFTEHNVIEFFEKELSPRNFLSKFIFTNFFSVKNDVAINSMKDIFIYNLLNRKLISISSAEYLDRKFKIINNNYYLFNYDLPF